MTKQHPAVQFDQKYRQSLNDLGLVFVRSYSYNADGFVEYRVGDYFLRVGIGTLDETALIFFGRMWAELGRETLSNNYQAFLDFFELKRSSEFCLNSRRMDEYFKDINELIHTTLPRILESLNETNLVEIEAMPGGVEFGYRKLLVHRKNLEPPVLLSGPKK